MNPAPTLPRGAAAGHALAPAPPDREPVPRPARLALWWDGRRWAEIDPATGDVVAVGCVDEERHEGTHHHG